LGGATVVTVVVKIVVNHRRPNSPAIGPRHGLARVVNHNNDLTALHATAVSCNIGSMSTSTRRAREYRERMRLRGYRPVQVWVPDVRSAAFAAEAHREALALAEADRHSDDMEFVEAISALGSLDDDA
jgi:hypothetical protein